MKKAGVIIILLTALVGGSLIAQELNVSASADVWTNVWMSRGSSISFDENTNFSSTLSLSYLHRFLDDAIKPGLGMSMWIPRTADENPSGDSRSLSFSDFAAYVAIHVYPTRFGSGQRSLADYLYIKANLGYNQPILFGDWASDRVNSVWGGFYFGVGAGMDTDFGLFVELLYNCYYWGGEIYSTGDLDNAGYQTFAIVFGYKFSFGESKY